MLVGIFYRGWDYVKIVSDDCITINMSPQPSVAKTISIPFSQKRWFKLRKKFEAFGNRPRVRSNDTISKKIQQLFLNWSQRWQWEQASHSSKSMITIQTVHPKVEIIKYNFEINGVYFVNLFWIDWSYFNLVSILSRRSNMTKWTPNTSGFDFHHKMFGAEIVEQFLALLQ